MLPTEKFPLGSKLRMTKAEIMSERAFRFVTYCSFSLFSYRILKNSKYLDTHFFEMNENPDYFLDYPC